MIPENRGDFAGCDRGDIPRHNHQPPGSQDLEMSGSLFQGAIETTGTALVEDDGTVVPRRPGCIGITCHHEDATQASHRGQHLENVTEHGANECPALARLEPRGKTAFGFPQLLDWNNSPHERSLGPKASGIVVCHHSPASCKDEPSSYHDPAS